MTPSCLLVAKRKVSRSISPTVLIFSTQTLNSGCSLGSACVSPGGPHVPACRWRGRWPRCSAHCFPSPRDQISHCSIHNVLKTVASYINYVCFSCFKQEVKSTHVNLSRVEADVHSQGRDEFLLVGSPRVSTVIDLSVRF